MVPKFATRFRVTAIACAALVASLFPFAGVAAVPPPPPTTISPATGGSAISADWALALPGSGTYTTLTGPSVASGSAGDLVGTLTLTIPSGFQFKASTGSASPSGAGCGDLATPTPTVTTTQVSLTTTGTTQTTPCSIVISGLQVVPTAGNPLASGNIAANGIVTGAAGTLTEVPGAAVITFTAQPGGAATGGSAFPNQPAVHDQDQFHNPRQDGVRLIIEPGTGTVGATLTCDLNPKTTDASGNATYSGCAIDKVGSNYRLRAYAGTNTAGGALSDPFSVAVGPADHLVFTQYPGTPTTTTLYPQPIVSVVDKGGNVVTLAATRTITLGLGTSPSGSVLACSGGNTRTLYSGQQATFTFSGCTVTKTGNHSLTASDSGGLTMITGGLFTVTSGPASTLALCWGPITTTCVTTPPTTITGGTAFPVQPTIVLQDANGNTVVTDNSTQVALSITAGTPFSGGPGTLTCTGGLTKTVSQGVASFSGCAIDKVGTSYRLTASSYPVYTAAMSAAFTVYVGPPVKLGFTSQPGQSYAASAFVPQPVVAIQDAGGNTVPTTSAMVTLSLISNPSMGILTCTGGLSRTTFSGVATFSGCAINAQGSGYVIQAVATSVAPPTYLSSAATNSFNVAAPQAQITLSSTSSLIIWASGITLTTQFGVNGANKTFDLEGSLDNVTWTRITTLTTDGSGRADLYYRPATSLFYRAAFAGTPDLSPGTSNVVRVRVRQIALLRPTYSYTRTVSRGTTVTFTTTVRPVGPTLPVSLVTFQIQRYWYGRWVAFTTRNAYIDSSGRATLAWRFGTAGLWRIRSYANWTLANENSLPTRWETYSVP